MSNSQFGLHGIESLTAKFGAINYDLKFKGGRAALRRAANLVRAKAEANALRVDDPKTREIIAKNIVVRFSKKRFQSNGDLMFRVGVLGGARMTSEADRKRRRRKGGSGMTLEELGEISGAGKGNPGGDTFYWRFVEFGTQRNSAKPFMRPALESSAQEATNEFIRSYNRSIDRAINKASKIGK